MAAAAYAVRKNRERKQKQAQQREDNRRFIEDVMKTWDESKTGMLQLDELQNWLTGINNNERVTEQEAKWVIWMCSQDEAKKSGDKDTGASYKDLKRQAVRPGELPAALEHWMAYRDSKPTLDGLFDRFDTDKSGWLSKEQLAVLLQEMNEGVAVTDTEVEWVMSHADVLGDGQINKPELSFAVSLWYNHQEKVKGGQVVAAPGCGGCWLQ